MVFNIENIRELLQEDKIQWSGHVLSRMQQREIKIKDLIETSKRPKLGDKAFPRSKLGDKPSPRKGVRPLS